jgi:hypothetical protein
LALQAAEIVEGSLEEVSKGTTLNETTMYGLLFGAEAEGLGELEKEAWVSDLVKNSANAANYLTSKKKEEKQEKTEIKEPTIPVPTPEGGGSALIEALGPMDTRFEQLRQKLVTFFTVDIPNWWNTYIAPFFT